MEIPVTSYAELLAMLDFGQLKFQSNKVSTPKLIIQHFDESKTNMNNVSIESISRDPISNVLHGFTKNWLTGIKQNVNISAGFTKLNAFVLIPSLDFDDKFSFKFFEHCSFSCKNTMYYIKRNCSLAKKLRKSKRYQQRTGKTNKNYAIDLTNYKLCMERLNKYEKYNIINDLQFCYQFINNKIIVIPNNYFYFIHFMIDKHNLQCPLNGFFSIFINNRHKSRSIKNGKPNLTEIYRFCNSACGYSRLVSKYAHQIIISDDWKKYYEIKSNKKKVLNKLANFDAQVLGWIDEQYEQLNSLIQQIYYLKRWNKNNNNNNYKSSEEMMLCRLCDRYSMGTNRLDILFRKSTRKDPFEIASYKGVSCDLYCQLHSIFDDGSIVSKINIKDNTYCTRLPDNITMRLVRDGRIIISDAIMHDTKELDKRLESPNWPEPEPWPSCRNVYAYFRYKYPNYYWVYKKNKDGEKVAWGITSSDRKHALACKHFGVRYRVLDCHYCGKRKDKMLVCKKCKSARYCNRKCQKRGWILKQHSKECHQMFHQYLSFYLSNQKIICS